MRLAYTPESKDLNWKDFLRSWIRIPEAIRWGLKSWRKPLWIIVGLASLVYFPDLSAADAEKA